jgi:hypothetical protein
VDTGIAVGGGLDVRGSVVVGWSPARVKAAVRDALTEDSRRGAAVAGRIEALSQRLEIGQCTVEKLLQLAAASQSSADEFTADFANYVSRHRALIHRIAELPAEFADQAGVRERALAAVEAGHYEEADQILISVGVGIAAGGDVVVGGDVTIGMTDEEVKHLIVFARSASAEHLQSIDDLSARLGVTRCATENFLRILGERQVPLEELSPKLAEIASRHVELVEIARTLKGINPEVDRMKREIAIAIEDGHYERADQLLVEAVARELAVAQRMIETASQVIADAMLVRASAAKAEAWRGDL